MTGPGTFLVDTGIPFGVLSISSTLKSVLVVAPNGTATLSGEISATLLSKGSKAVSLSGAEALTLGPPDPRTGNRPLLASPAIRVRTNAECKGSNHGPTLYYGTWTFRKASGAPIEVELSYQTICICDQAAGLQHGDRFMLLLPGDGHDPSQSWSWKHSGESGYLVDMGDAGYCIETNTVLYHYGAFEFGAVVTFPAPSVVFNRPLTVELNHHLGKKVRLRLFVANDGVPTGLQVDAPESPRSGYQMRLAIPGVWGVSLRSDAVGDGAVPLERVWFSEGRCEFDVDRDDRVEIRLGPCATLVGPGARFQFRAALVVATHDTRVVKAVELIERRSPPPSSSACEAFDGLRIAGLHSTGRAREVLEVVQPSVVLVAAGGHVADPSRPIVRFTSLWLGPRKRQLSHDADVGVLDIPLPKSLLRVRRASMDGDPAPSPLRYELLRHPQAPTLKWQGALAFCSCELLVPTLGSTATAGASPKAASGSGWNQYLVKVLPAAMEFQATQASSAPDLRLEGDWFRQWDLGPQVDFVLHDQAELGAAFSKIEFQRSVSVVSSAAASGENAGFAYAGLALVLGYIAAEYKGQGWKSFFHRKLSLSLNEGDLNKWAEKHKELENLVFTLDRLGASADQQSWFVSFVLENLKASGGTEPPARALWPFSPGLGIPLYDGADPLKATWVWSLPRNGTLHACQFAFDYSTTDTLDPSRVGPYPAFLADEPKKVPRLWPRSRTLTPGTLPGTGLDPADKRWQGIFLSDVPLVIAVDIPDGAAFLQSLSDRINAGLLLEYGWLDATGHTWKVKLSGATKTQIYPTTSQKDPPYAIFLWDFSTTGSAGETVTAALTMSVELNAIKSKDGKPTELKGTGTFGLVDGQSSEFELIPVAGTEIATDSLPGFDKIALRRFRTDFKTASLQVELVPSDDLKRVLPWFNQENLQASLSIPVSADEADVTLSVMLPAEAPSRLFEKWPVSVRGFAFSFGESALLNETKVSFALDVGTAVLKRIGGVLTITRKGSDLVYGVTVDDLNFDLSLLGVGLKGQLRWRSGKHEADDPAPTNAVEYDEAKDRDFYGAVSLSGLVDGANAGLYLRISSGARPFWVVALKKQTEPRVAGTTVEEAGLMLAYGAERILTTGQKPLSDYLVAPESLDPSLFPGPGNDPVEWLNKWQPATDGMGLVVGLQGKFQPDAILATASAKDNLTLVWSDTGLFYGKTVVNIFSTVPATLSLLVDFKEQYANASLQLPAAPISGSAELSPGLMSVSFGWGDTKGFGLSLGYPPLLPSTIGSARPDWSKAITVRIPQAWPINTFQGGVKAYYYSEPSVKFGFAIAIRAGYSNSFRATGSDLADARAYVEVMVAGTFAFCKDSTRPFNAPRALAIEAAMNDDDKWLAETINKLTSQRKSSDKINIAAAIYGDVKGHASVVFLGVTLAGVGIDASAMFEVLGELNEGITRMRAEFTFQVRVEIGCDTFETSATFSVVMIDKGGGTPGGCNALMRELRDRAIELSEDAT